MKNQKYRVTSSTGVDLGTYEAATEQEAIEAASRAVDLRKHGVVDEGGKAVGYFKVDKVS